eukprot:scaffold9695_cov181-Amphora_coffeaeformis.AAC.3
MRHHNISPSKKPPMLYILSVALLCPYGGVAVGYTQRAPSNDRAKSRQRLEFLISSLSFFRPRVFFSSGASVRDARRWHHKRGLLVGKKQKKRCLVVDALVTPYILPLLVLAVISKRATSIA